MTTRWHLVFALLSSVAGLCAQASDAPRRRPNILMVFSDDHACHALSAYGSKINQTPNLDRLARDGMRFDRAFVTNSICAPSRAVLLTGMHSHKNGQRTNHERFDGAQVTFPKLLQAAGYQTGLIGKWHLGSDPTGFDSWRILIGQGTYYNPRFKCSQSESKDGIEKVPGYVTDLITDAALAWLDRRDKERPFLLFVQHKAPHREWTPAARHLSLYADADIPEPPTLFDDWQGRAPGAAQQTMTVARHLSDLDLKLVLPANLDDAQRAALAPVFARENAPLLAPALDARARARLHYQRYIKDYLRCVAAVDEGVGRVLDWLDREQLADDTIVIYASDQGFFLGDHGYYDKRFMYEEALRFPLLVRWPGVASKGAADAHLVQNLDLAPTLLAAAGVAVPGTMQGRSLVPLLRGDAAADWRRSIYYHYWENPGDHDVPRHFGVRTARHKLIHYYEIGAFELFDLETDPRELTSVYADPAYASVRAELAAELTRLQQECGDDTPRVHLPFLERAARSARAARVAKTEVLRLAEPGEAIVARPEPMDKPLTFGARCTPGRGEGVVLAHGGNRFGYALYFVGGVPCAAVRDGGVGFVACGTKIAADREALVAGVLGADMRLHLLVDGERVASVDAALLSRNPSEGLSVGRDTGSAVGDYNGESPFAGALRDVRLYYGELSRAEWNEWRGR